MFSYQSCLMSQQRRSSHPYKLPRMWEHVGTARKLSALSWSFCRNMSLNGHLSMSFTCAGNFDTHISPIASCCWSFNRVQTLLVDGVLALSSVQPLYRNTYHNIRSYSSNFIILRYIYNICHILYSHSTSSNRPLRTPCAFCLWVACMPQESRASGNCVL